MFLFYSDNILNVHILFVYVCVREDGEVGDGELAEGLN